MYQEHSELKKLVPLQLTPQLLVQLVLISIKERGTTDNCNEQIDTSSLGDRIVNREVIQFMRLVTFSSRPDMKPFTEVYPFFDNVDVKQFCFQTH